MSYKPLRNEDSLSELISEVNDFNQIAQRMIKAKDNFNEYLVWSQKALQINPRAYYIFLKENDEKFCEKIRDYNRPFMTKVKSRKKSLNYCLNRGWLTEE